ncbi:hypothetical protein DID75_03220 [Candidatus Marinamargulisbacteria bacterium SCGC AG-410-N11]|nr:hypothetical protein DID75_03220 [Candidatus Marinamargulisbacteria bacterium SCGC AG-410-N11]
MLKKTCCYIFPFPAPSEDLSLKIQSQLSVLNNHYATNFVSKPTPATKSKLLLYFYNLIFVVKAILYATQSNIIYYRFHPNQTLLNISLIALSYIKIIYVEHFYSQIKHNPPPKLIRKLSLFLKLSNSTHITPTQQLKRLIQQYTSKTHKVQYTQNGFSYPKIKITNIDSATVAQLSHTLQKKSYKKIAVFSGNGDPWQPISEIIQYIEKEPNILVIVMGPYEPIKHPQFIFLGILNTETRLQIYKLADFGISIFKWNSSNFEEECPLKTREYLCMGLPILVNYFDSANDFIELSPSIFNIKTNNQALSDIINQKENKTQLQNIARKKLDWSELWKYSILKHSIH